MAAEILSELTGQEIKAEMEFIIPQSAVINQTISRPELEQFQKEKMQLESLNLVLKHSRYPVVAGFGQLGYGNPGYNMLLDSRNNFV